MKKEMCCRCDYVGVTVAAASFTGVQALVGIIWNVFAVMIYNCEVTFEAHGSSGFLSYLEYVRERYFFDERVCRVSPQTAKGWSFGTNVTNVSMGGSASTQPASVQIWIIFYLVLNVVWLVSIAPLILGIASRRPSWMLPWTLVTSAACLADFVATALFSADLDVPVSRYEDSVGSEAEVFFGNRLAAAMFLPIVFARGITVWIGNLFFLFAVHHVYQRVRSGKPLTDAERLEPSSAGGGGGLFDLASRTTELEMKDGGGSSLKRANNNNAAAGNSNNNKLHHQQQVLPRMIAVQQQRALSSRYCPSPAYDNADTLPASEATLIVRPYRPDQYILNIGVEDANRPSSTSLASAATKKKNRRSMPVDLIINVDPTHLNRSSSTASRAGFAGGVFAAAVGAGAGFPAVLGRRSPMLAAMGGGGGGGGSSSVLVAASTPNLIDATKEFDFKRFAVAGGGGGGAGAGSTGAIRRPNDPLPPIDRGAVQSDYYHRQRRPSACSSSSESHLSLDRRGFSTKRIHRINETPSPAAAAAVALSSSSSMSQDQNRHQQAVQKQDSFNQRNSSNRAALRGTSAVGTQPTGAQIHQHPHRSNKPASAVFTPRPDEPVNLSGFLRSAAAGGSEDGGGGGGGGGARAAEQASSAPAPTPPRAPPQQIILISPYSPPWDAVLKFPPPPPPLLQTGTAAGDGQHGRSRRRLRHSPPRYHPQVLLLRNSSSASGGGGGVVGNDPACGNIYEELVPDDGDDDECDGGRAPASQKPQPARIAEEVYYYSEDDLSGADVTEDSATTKTTAAAAAAGDGGKDATRERTLPYASVTADFLADGPPPDAGPPSSASSSSSLTRNKRNSRDVTRRQQQQGGGEEESILLADSGILPSMTSLAEVGPVADKEDDGELVAPDGNDDDDADRPTSAGDVGADANEGGSGVDGDFGAPAAAAPRTRTLSMIEEHDDGETTHE